MLCGETVAVYCDNRTEHINTLCGKILGGLLQEYFVLREAVQMFTTVLEKVSMKTGAAECSCRHEASSLNTHVLQDLPPASGEIWREKIGNVMKVLSSQFESV
jgi:hypothetical protein